MADSKSGMNLPSRTSFVISDLKTGISGMRQETSLLNQEWSSLVQKMGTGVTKFNSVGERGPGGLASTKVAPDPVFNNSNPNSGNLVAAGASGNGGGFSNNNGSVGGGDGGNGGGGGGGGNLFRNLSEFISNNKTGSALYGMGTALGAAQATSDMVQAQLLMQRTAANMPLDPGLSIRDENTGSSYGQKASRYEYARRSATQMAKMGQANSNMDAFNAMTAAQSYGLTGTNYLQNANNPSKFEGSIAAQIANASNLTPGIGLEGMTRAAGGMQKGRNVNMLKGVGINIRDSNGNMKGPEEIIDDLWRKICRDYSGAYGSSKTPSEREIQIGFQQGNSMDQLVQNMFGDDPLIYMTIKNGLIYKAKSGGGAITKENVTDFGMTTDAVNTFAMKQALGTEQLGLVSNFGAGAYNVTQKGLNAVTFALNATDASAGPGAGPLKILNGVAAIMQTLGGAAGGAGSSLMKFLMGILGLQGKAAGGSVDDKQPYVVGEKGPELFIPKTDGVIIPNHLGPFRHEGGGVLAKGHSHTWGKNPLAKSTVKDILSKAGFTGQALEDALQIAQGESGYNPLAFNGNTKTGDTSYGLMQINMLGNLGPGRRKWFGLKKDEELYEAEKNAKAAYLIYKDRGYRFDKDWVTQSAKLASKGQPGGASTGPLGNYQMSTGSSTSSSSSSAPTDNAVMDKEGIAAVTKYLGKDFGDAYKEYLKTGEIGNISLAGLVGDGARGAGLASTLGGAITNNYGGVTFNMNVLGGDPDKLNSAFKSWFEKLQTGVGVSGQ